MSLRAQPGARTGDLCARLGGINKSTLTRGLKVLGDEAVSRGGSRRTAYALRRAIRGNAASVPLYRIDEAGRGHQIGLLDSVYPTGTALSFQEPFPWPLTDEMRDGWFDGLPYPRLAAAVMAQDVPGSSAGDKFPKFTASRLLHGQPVEVIVSFPALTTPRPSSAGPICWFASILP